MKYRFALCCLLLIGCRPRYASYEQQVVTESIEKAMGRAGTNFSSYIPVSWDVQPLSRRDSVLWQIGSPEPAFLASLPRARRREVEQAISSAAYQDTARIGSRVVHIFRWKEEDSRLVSDTVRCLVFRNGYIARLL